MCVLYMNIDTRKKLLDGVKAALNDQGRQDVCYIDLNYTKVTEGLDGLRDRLKEYVELGAGFTKWRAVMTITDDTPTPYGLSANAHALARFAAMSQEAGLVPIVEPEILRDGDHSIDRCFEVTEEALREVFDQLAQQKVLLEGMLLKPSMVQKLLNQPLLKKLQLKSFQNQPL